VPSAFNSQSARVVLLLGEQHAKLWSIVLETLRKIVPAAAFEGTASKIASFAAGHGSVLYFEDQDVVTGLQHQFPTYADNFPIWSQHTSAMHQFAIWTMLEDAGLGVSVQHYNPLIDDAVRKEWNLPASWRLIAQMPFGAPTAEPGAKVFAPLEERMKVFK
jgi:predicted oxidoreductase (fatty acid repression mutant protein)